MTESSSATKTNAPLVIMAAPPWTLAVLAAALYPFLLPLFPMAMRRLTEAQGLLQQGFWGASATLAISLLFGIPLLAFWALMKTPSRATPKSIAARRVLLVAFAASPLYGFTRLLAGRAGLVDWYGEAWLVAAVAAAIYVMRASDDRVAPALKPRSGIASSTALRAVHGAAAVLLFVGFLFPHILNHAVALWSVDLQKSWMAALRLWYRADFVEPVLLGGLGLMILTGIPLVLRNTRLGGNLWRTLQGAAGVYVIIFLCSHISAVLFARAAGWDTDWVFATGRKGLLAGPATQIPYYVLSIAVVMIHASLGVRMAMIRRGVEAIRVSKIFRALMWFAGLTTLWVTVAVMGVQLAG